MSVVSKAIRNVIPVDERKTENPKYVDSGVPLSNWSSSCSVTW